MFETVLVANRGEIARRVIRTCQRLGIKAVAVYSEADADARHVREADEAVLLGPPPAAQSYLDGRRVLEAAHRSGAEAVHPGYGFLAENAAFVRAVEAAGLVFIGPSAATIERIGGKASAKREAARLGLPVIAGGDTGLLDVAAIAAQVRGMSLPVLLKAVAGGGGRGMAVIATTDGVEARIESAMREAEQAFGSGELIVERYLPRVRHIEVQIAGDGQGAAIHLYERECTLQRRHQKLIEEAPAAGLPAALLDAMRADACRLAVAVSYRGLGTVEFIVAGDAHHFLEVNPRLQVEHPVTEEITGLDLVELQLRIADAGRLPLAQADVRCSGHAFEARLCAEDPAAGFLPATGRIALARFPGPPLRVEAGVASGDAVTPHYDSMIAKLIAHADTREGARALLLSGLAETTVIGVVTNLAALQELLALPQTRDSTFHTRLVDERYAAERAAPTIAPPFELLCAAALLWLESQRRSPASVDLGCWTDWKHFTGWRLAHAVEAQPAGLPTLLLGSGGHEWAVRFARREADGSMRIAIGERVERAALESFGDARYLLQCAGSVLDLSMVAAEGHVGLASVRGHATLACVPYVGGVSAEAEPSGQLAAPMMGKVVAIRAQPGDRVEAGQIVIVLESMKMELHVNAPFAATVQSVRCALGEMVERGAVLAEVSPDPSGRKE